MNQTSISVIKYCLIGAILGFICFLIKPLRSFGFSFLFFTLWFGQLIGLLSYLVESKIYKTLYFKIILIGITVFMIGILIKLQHWNGSSFVMLCSFIIISTSYLMRFLAKINRTINDFIKVFWLLFVFLACYFEIMHWILADLFIYISFAIF